VIGTRPLANAVGRAAETSGDEAIAAYRRRWEALDLDFGPLPPDEAALRFAAFVPGVSTVLVATRRVEHLVANLAALARGPLPDEIQGAIRARFRERGGDWPGVV
jgi:aryl-alcohol dehydrogenase-like predicted oxidoreductase